MTHVTDEAQNVDDDPILDTRGAAEHLKLSTVTLHQWRLVGKGPAFYRFGRQIRYRLRDIRSYMEARRVGGEK
ncbi:MAG: helix-turn-helix domain-containing protein [Proteobacteria bacterium]|nr:helix-turn-helix domain-containing protein [Pseudomonadota bacterium]